MAIGPLMLDLHTTELSSEEQLLLLNPLVGGVIYFSRNFESIDQIKQLTSEVRAVRPELLIAVDQEGGRVQRFREGFTPIPAMQSFLKAYRHDSDNTLKLVKNTGWLMAIEILSLGIDFSFAPVLDTDDCFCSVIADRAFSPIPSEVTALAGAWIDGMKEAGMAVTGKHFPGHGKVALDSHLDMPIDERPLSEIETSDMIPFVDLAHKLDAIMPAHILFPQIDKHFTVGFSHQWLQIMLREKLQFDGVIFSDDLSMEGAAAVGGYVSRAKQALSAGCDMILLCNHREGVLEVIDELSYQNSSESLNRLNKMRYSGTTWNDSLKHQPRWQQTKKSLESLY